jgi:hypothetical protein
MPKRPAVEVKPLPRSDGMQGQSVPGKQLDAAAQPMKEMQTGKFGANAGKPGTGK